MRAQCLGSLLLSAGLVVSAPSSPGASERSELLVAKGEVAYHRGLYEDARVRFAEAVAADPADAAAHYQLGLALLALERRDEAETALERALALKPEHEAARRALALARGEEAPAPEVTRPGTPSAPSGGRKRWEIHATTGFQYDSNVTIAPGGAIGKQFGDKDDAGFILSGGGRYDLLDREDSLIRLEYDLYQTLHVSLTDFDFRAHHVRGTASHALYKSFWGGVEGGYHHYTLGPHSYLSEPTVMPFLSLLEGSWGLTQLAYRFGYDTYLSRPYNEVRDGPTNAVGLTQNLYGRDGASYATMGYQYGTEDPRCGTCSAEPLPGPTDTQLPVGNDFALQFHQAYAGVGIPVWWKVAIDLMYLYRYDDYTHPNSFVDFRKARHDSTHYFYASVSRPIIPHVSVALAYFGTIDYSNISLFEYHRNVVSAVLEVTY
jgi:tetratricopeptide repeat protein